MKITLLAIVVGAMARTTRLAKTVELAIVHPGDSDTTGAISPVRVAVESTLICP